MIRNNKHPLDSGLQNINLDTIFKMQNDLEPYDIISLVFLLYEVPETALQRLLVYQRSSKNVENDNISLLLNWVTHSQNRPTWKYELLEALCICRLYRIIKRLGFDVDVVKQHYHPNNILITSNVHPGKKLLYRLCENITAENLDKLKKSLLSFDIDTIEYESCELIFLELMSRKLIILPQPHNLHENKVDFGCLPEILKRFPELNDYTSYLIDMQDSFDYDNAIGHSNTNINVTKKSQLVIEKSTCEKESNDAFDLLNQLVDENISYEFKSDNIENYKDAYSIKNTERVGVCCIINQNEFYPLKQSIENKMITNLETRHGSTKDKNALEKIMKLLNFEVKSATNLDHKQMFTFIRDVIKDFVIEDDSIFILCVLSHGVRGCIFTADSVQVKIEDIQKLLDSDIGEKLHGKPKVLIVQACQVDVEPENNRNRFVADGPSTTEFLRKSDFLIYWATAPEYKAYRNEEAGSIFIQILCIMLKKLANKEHLYDIFTKVTHIVTKICTKIQKAQVPIFESTLRKKLYLKMN
ncbi:caspase-8-like [Leptidea sinapis]|uniref:caspase-8-like n=1 Tax=Leptidea sinapis TaxID=189913 RepID=UPI0021C3AE25|nr:caspase-8-like [Leptidea sinapis]XP_050678517.1 caspase-8-like [Leptidea sinapis]